MSQAFPPRPRQPAARAAHGLGGDRPARPSPLFDEDASALVYFSHAYHLVCNDPADVAATAHYGYDFAAAVHRGNIMGTQFHPEKSHVFGLDVYRRFIENGARNSSRPAGPAPRGRWPREDDEVR